MNSDDRFLAILRKSERIDNEMKSRGGWLRMSESLPMADAARWF